MDEAPNYDYLEVAQAHGPNYNYMEIAEAQAKGQVVNPLYASASSPSQPDGEASRGHGVPMTANAMYYSME